MIDNTSGPLTDLSKIGEFGLIDRIVKDFTPQNPSYITGPGDDCAVFSHKDGLFELVSTDLLMEGVHFNLSYCPLKHLGYKSVAVNLSDIFAMNGRPTGITVSLGMSNKFTVEAVEELYKGIRLACEAYNVNLLGGDTSSSKSGLCISITALGVVKENEILYRSGGKNTNLVCVSGNVGAAYAGLQILERENKVFHDNPAIQPDLSGFEYAVGRQLKPEARGDILAELKNSEILPTSMIDLSDGLASDLWHICKSSNCGATLYQDKIPIDYETNKIADEFELSSLTYALNGGEDYELLFTVDVNDYDKILKIPNIAIIGFLNPAEDGVNLITKAEQVIPIRAHGWNHFEIK